MKKVISILSLLAMIPTLATANTMDVDFSGGSGSVLTLTLNESYSFVATSNATNYGILFLIDSVGNICSDVRYDITSNITLTVNGVSHDIDFLKTGYSFNDMTADDLYILSSSIPNGTFWIYKGDVITISTGTITTTSSISGVASSGTYSVYFTDYAGNTIEVDAAVPEPAECAFGIGALVLIPALILRRRPKAAF
jgi:hypothetical protein